MARQIRALPIAPSSARPATFNAEADAFVAALSEFVSDANALAIEAEQNSSNLTTAVDNASASANAAKQSETNAKASEQVATAAAQSANESKQSAAQSATSALSSAQTATGVESRLQQALGTLEQVEQIIQNGIIDDTEPKALKAFSSKKVDDDYVPKNKDVSDPRLYGKKLTTSSEASSVVLRDNEGYILNTMPATLDFSKTYNVCVRGSDNKERFASLETIYKKGLKEIIGVDFTENTLDVFDTLYSTKISGAKVVRTLKNGDIFICNLSTSNNYQIFSSDFQDIPLAPPSSGLRITCLFDAEKSIFAYSDHVLYKFIDNNGSYSWQQISLPSSGTFARVVLYINRHVYVRINQGVAPFKVKKLQGDSWVDADFTIPQTNTLIHKDGVYTSNSSFIVYDKYLVSANEIFDLDTWQNDTSLNDANRLKGIVQLSSGSDSFFIFPGEFEVVNKSIKPNIIHNLKTKKEYAISQADNLFSYSGINMFKRGGEYYVLANINNSSSIAKVNKKLLKHYGVI